MKHRVAKPIIIDPFVVIATALRLPLRIEHCLFGGLSFSCLAFRAVDLKRQSGETDLSSEFAGFPLVAIILDVQFAQCIITVMQFLLRHRLLSSCVQVHRCM